MDWLLPGRDGVEILKNLRARGTQMPVLLLNFSGLTFEADQGCIWRDDFISVKSILLFPS